MLTDIPWPEGLKKALQWFSIMNLEITLIPSAACMLDDMSFLGQLLFFGLAPVVVILVSHCMHSCACLRLLACACTCLHAHDRACVEACLHLQECASACVVSDNTAAHPVGPPKLQL